MKFFDPQYTEFQKTQPMPRVVQVMDRLAHQWTESPTLKELGYVEYDKDILMRATYYARRPWVWLLKTALWFKWKWFTAVYWGYGKLWHLSSLDGTRFRLSDLRPGSGAMTKARADIAGLRLQIDTQHDEINGHKREREREYQAGQLKGWDQHVQVVEQFLDERAKGAVQEIEG